jgi:N-acylneuraminate cytidylyltransferase
MERNNRHILAIIPARGGSKSIPRKNIQLLGGYPLISYSIAAGLNSQYIDRVIVSTDDAEIAQIAEQYGAEVPFIRPAELAEDHVTDLPVFEHAVQWLEENDNYHADIILQLRPTSPFRPKGSVDEAIELMLQSRLADSVRGVTPSGQNPYKMWRVENNRMVPLLNGEFDEPYNMPRQKLPATYWQTGHIEVIRYETIMYKHSMTGDHIIPYIIDSRYALDLDNLQQWEYAEYMLEFIDEEIYQPLDLWNSLEEMNHQFVMPLHLNENVLSTILRVR